MTECSRGSIRRECKGASHRTVQGRPRLLAPATRWEDAKVNGLFQMPTAA
jgi:hypothetical protein